MTATSPPGPADDLERYVGLETAEAEHQARSRGWLILRTVAPGAMVTMEFRAGRLNFEVEEDRVKRAWQG
ncbi:I78 family peptidase inhibitor [Streptomyces goshikiensis]|uniref:I78 family peptidase inhibitor n=1 Tax=Streptomyces goshikiensis TaxID=1942 RepID=UPI0036AD148C